MGQTADNSHGWRDLRPYIVSAYYCCWCVCIYLLFVVSTHRRPVVPHTLSHCWKVSVPFLRLMMEKPIPTPQTPPYVRFKSGYKPYYSLYLVKDGDCAQAILLLCTYSYTICHIYNKYYLYDNWRAAVVAGRPGKRTKNECSSLTL